MKRIVLFVVGVIAVSSSPSAQAPNDAVATALLGLPANVREGATVIKWKPDQTYDTLQKGTNGLVCYDRSGFPLQQPFSVECTSMGNLPRVAHLIGLLDQPQRPAEVRFVELQHVVGPERDRIEGALVGRIADRRPRRRQLRNDDRAEDRADQGPRHQSPKACVKL